MSAAAAKAAPAALGVDVPSVLGETTAVFKKGKLTVLATQKTVCSSIDAEFAAVWLKYFPLVSRRWDASGARPGGRGASCRHHDRWTADGLCTACSDYAKLRAEGKAQEEAARVRNFEPRS